MSSLSDFMGAGSKPKLITRYTSGTGTYVPTADMARCFVRVQAGGGGGGNCGGSPRGGGGGAMVEVMIRIPIAGFAYAVGAGGTGHVSSPTNGSASTFGPYTAAPGKAYIGGSSNPLDGSGGISGGFSGSVDTDSATLIAANTLNGVSGGGGGDATYHGMRCGHPIHPSVNINTLSISGYVIAEMQNGQGMAAGGDSFFGKGAVALSPPASDAYGAGGSGHSTTPTNGKGGVIEIWDYGA